MKIGRAVALLVVLIAFAALDGRARADEPPTCAMDEAMPGGVGNAAVAVEVGRNAVDQAPGPADSTTAPGAVQPDPPWQPRGGTVAFTVRANAPDLKGVAVVACFRWSLGQEGAEACTKKAAAGGTNAVSPSACRWHSSPRVWVTRFTDNEVTYNAIVPRDLGARTDSVQKMAFGMVPLADFRVIVTGGPAGAGVQVVRPLGITSPGFAAFCALAAAAIALLMFRAFAKMRGVPGDDILLWLISTRNGVASLSQLQIMLWTFVVGAGAIYVMVLSGTLINITSGTLTLLGIAGVATLGSKLQNSQAGTDGQGQAAPGLAVPAAVADVQQAGAASESDIRLVWSPPAGVVRDYLVEYRVAGATTGWNVVGEPVTAPHCTVLWLTPDTNYEFQVTARNEAGSAAASPIKPYRTDALPQLPPGAPGEVAGVQVRGAPSNREITVEWLPADGATFYAVQYRRHGSLDPWLRRPQTPRAPDVIANLEPGAAYDIRVAAGNAAGIGRWSYVLVARTARQPKLSDLVVAGPGRGEVDVTRVQMLFFTVITALFVAMTVATTYVIPDIPTGFLLLMGISNGVYLGNKFIGPGS